MLLQVAQTAQRTPLPDIAATLLGPIDPAVDLPASALVGVALLLGPTSCAAEDVRALSCVGLGRFLHTLATT